MKETEKSKQVHVFAADEHLVYVHSCASTTALPTLSGSI